MNGTEVKLYLAAPYAARDILKEHVTLLQKHGHEVTSSWLNGTRPLEESSFGTSPSNSDLEVYNHVCADLADIDRSDVVVHYTAAYVCSIDPRIDDAPLHTGGRHVETGYALSKNIPVLVLGEYENVFQRGLCMGFDNLEDVLVGLQVLRWVP
jgi:nucleoside 2-deoxyribosyltransferase